MNDNETTADVIAAMRDEAARADMEQEYSIDDAAEMMREFAWRFEAAHKREKAAIEADALAVGGMVAAAAEKPSAVGNAAKLREALKAICGLCDGLTPTWDGAVGRIKDMADAALAAPPRNCDRFASAEEAWDAYDEWAESYRAQGKTELLNEVGWLFATATNKEGDKNVR